MFPGVTFRFNRLENFVPRLFVQNFQIQNKNSPIYNIHTQKLPPLSLFQLLVPLTAIRSFIFGNVSPLITINFFANFTFIYTSVRMLCVAITTNNDNGTKEGRGVMTKER